MVGIIFLITGIVLQCQTPILESFWEHETPILSSFAFSIILLGFFTINIIEDRKYNEVLDLCLMDNIIQEILSNCDKRVSEKFLKFALKARVDELNDIDQKYINNNSFVNDLIKRYNEQENKKENDLKIEKEMLEDLEINKKALEFIENIKENKIGKTIR